MIFDYAGGRLVLGAGVPVPATWQGGRRRLASAADPALAAAWASSLRVGTAIIPAYTRGPALIAQSAAALAEAAPGRCAIGIGTSSDVIVGKWNDIAFTEPYRRVRDTLRFLRQALAGQRVDRDYGTFALRGLRLARPVPDPPPLYLAALRSGMLRLAGREVPRPCRGRRHRTIRFRSGLCLSRLAAEGDVAADHPDAEA